MQRYYKLIDKTPWAISQNWFFVRKVDTGSGRIRRL